MNEICLKMGYIRCINKLVLITFILNSCTVESQSNIVDDQIEHSINGEWICVKNTWRNVTKYGVKEVRDISRTTLVVDCHEIYFKSVDFIDTCYYSSIKNLSFFDREEKESSYITDGALVTEYTDEELNQFRRLELIGADEYNCLNLLYLHNDTLILNYCGGITFFFVRKPVFTKLYSGAGNKKEEILLSGEETMLELESDFYSKEDQIILKDESGNVLFDSNMITTNGGLNKKISIEKQSKIYFEIKSSSKISRWKVKVTFF